MGRRKRMTTDEAIGKAGLFALNTVILCGVMIGTVFLISVLFL